MPGHEYDRGIILEDANGHRRTIKSGRQIRPPRKPGERIVGATPLPRVNVEFKMCSNCNQVGVFEYT